MLKELKTLIDELNSTNSSNSKKEILKKYPNLSSIIEYTYNPFKVFGVTSDVIKKFNKPVDYLVFKEDQLFSLLDNLSSRKVTGHDAIRWVLSYIKCFPEYTDLVHNIIDKDLKCRLGVTEINKVFPNLIPTFEVTLADTFEESSKVNENWVIQRKLDGIRCIAVYNNGEVKFYSRNGKEFNTLGVLKTSIEDYVKKNDLSQLQFVLDGELCIVDENGNEDFTAITKEYSRKNHTIKNPMFIMFDWLTYDEFTKKRSIMPYIDRHACLKKQFSGINNTTILEYEKYSEKTFQALLSNARSNGWEGLMLRNNVGYEGKRTKNLLKVKDFKDGEFKVKSVITGPFRIIDPKTGLESTIETMVAVEIDYKGETVKVGSGFSLEERQHFFLSPSKICNKIITVKYFQESKNKDGKLSLRFPIFKTLHGDKREV